MYAAPFQQSYPFTRISEKKLTYIREEPYNKNVTNVLKRLNTIQFPVIMDGGDMINKRENVKRGFFFLTFLLFLLMLALPVSASEADSSENAKEYVTVKFCMSDGTTNSTYQAMTVKVVKGYKNTDARCAFQNGICEFWMEHEKECQCRPEEGGRDLSDQS